MKISGHGFTMTYTNATNMKDKFFTILPATNFAIGVEKLNHSPKLQRYYLSDGFDFSDLDISQHVKVKLSPLKLNFTQEVYTYMLRCNDLNICYSD